MIRLILNISIILFFLPSTIVCSQNLNLGNEEKANKEISNYQLKKIQANRHTVGLITGSISGTYIRIGSDLANVLDSSNMRVLTMLGTWLSAKY